ncbi:hypothetical protein, partial [Desulfosarcina cetonica]
MTAGTSSDGTGGGCSCEYPTIGLDAKIIIISRVRAGFMGFTSSGAWTPLAKISGSNLGFIYTTQHSNSSGKRFYQGVYA